MHVRTMDGGVAKFGRFIALTAGSVGLFAMPAFLSVAAYTAFSLQKINQNHAVSVEVSEWSQLLKIAELKLRLEQPLPVMGPEPLVADEVLAPVAPVMPIVRQQKIASDQIRIHAAAPAHILAKKHRAPAIAASAPKMIVAAPAPVVEEAQDDFQMMQSAHAMLRRQFFVAMNTQVMTAEPALALSTQPDRPEADSQLSPVREPGWRPLHRKNHGPQGPKKPSSLVAAAPIVAEGKKAEPAPQAESVAEKNGFTNDEVQSAVEHALKLKAETESLQVAKVEPKRELAESNLTEKKLDTQPENEYSPSVEMAGDGQAVAAAVEVPTAEPVKSVTKEKKDAQPEGSLLPFEMRAQQLWSKYTAEAEKTRANAPVTVISHSVAQAPVAVTTPPAPPAPPTKPAVPDYSEASVHSTEVSLAAARTVASQPAITAYDAFNSNQEINSARIVPYTIEGEKAGWTYAEAPDHWSTLTRSSKEIPMISSNTAKLLGTLAQANLEPQAGVLFGRIPIGWSVRISGRSERPLFLNERNQTVAAQNMEEVRTFVFLNVAPGAHLLYLTNRLGVEEGAIGVVVLGGVSTYADVTEIKRTSITGRVLDGGNSAGAPIANATVRILGSVAGQTVTNEKGFFRIDGVVTVDEHPVFVETDAKDGNTHRYQLRSTDLRDTVLYRLDSASLQTWLGQLEGSISPESGLIVGAVPNVIAAEEGAKLTPKLKPLSPSATLQPETYTLSVNGQMQAEAPLDAKSTRFVSVQVSEGPALVSIEGADQNVRRSEILMTSPGVVSLFGPY